MRRIVLENLLVTVSENLSITAKVLQNLRKEFLKVKRCGMTVPEE